MKSAHTFIGTSGWNYAEWRDDFYGRIPHEKWLSFYARHFNAVEVNTTFYRHPRKGTFEHWREETPAGFVFAIKGHRYVTHRKRLAEASLLPLSREAAAGLGDKLAVVLWQTPRSQHKDVARLDGFAGALAAWPEARHVLEFRHASWFDAEVADCLRRHRIGNCLSDAADWPLWDVVTTDLVYLRLHGHTDTYASVYSQGELNQWAERVRVWQAEGRDVHVYFDNTASCAALDNAQRLKEMLG